MILINSLDYWGWEAMTLTSGLIGVREQASQVMLINMANQPSRLSRMMRCS